MRSKNSPALTKAESAHVALVKMCGCVVCDASPPNEAHHIEQGQHFTVVAVCADCHSGSFNGWHGQRVMWRLKKLDELKALNLTLERVDRLKRIAA